MKSLNFSRLKDIVHTFNKARVLVVGDLILDEFIWGSVSRISPEAPVPVVWVDRENFMPGGASNVAGNIRSLGGEAHLAGVVGDDARGQILQAVLRKKGVHCEGIFADRERPTTQKTRVIAHHQHVARIDREIVRPIPENILKSLVDFIEKKIHDVDALIIEDYGKGVVVPRLVQQIVRIAKKNHKIITVDPKETHISYYKGVTTITPNHHEAGIAVEFPVKDNASLECAGRKLLSKLRCQSVLITQGENGMSLFQSGRATVKIGTVAQDVFDVSGAGDTVISAFTLAKARKATDLEAAHISNCAAGIVVGKVGVAVTTQKELIEKIRKKMALN